MLGEFDVDPQSGFGGLEDGVADILGAEGVAEIGVGFFRARIVEAFHELDSAVDEGVLVTEAESGDPPVAGIGVIAIGDVDAGPATGLAGDVVVEVGETIEIVEVPGEGFVVTVDLESFEGLVAAGVARGFEDGGGAIFEAGEESAGVVDGDGVDFAGFLVHAFLDEGFRHGRNAHDVAVDPAGAVDVVGKKIAGDAGTGGGGIETPEGSASLGKVFGHRPVLQEIRAVVVDATEISTVDDLLGERDGREEAIVIPDKVGETRGLDGLHHFESLFAIKGEGFFAEDHLAVFNGGHGNIEMGVVWGADIDGIDIVAFH